MTIRVLLVDDHEIVRQGLRALMAEEEDVELIGEAGDGREAMRLAEQLRPDVVVMDIAMPGLNGVEATRRIRELVPGLQVVALSMHADKRFVRQMLMSGASAYLRKGCKFSELITAIRNVAEGKGYLSPEIARTITEDYTRRLQPKDSSAASLLTPREREVLQLLAEGHRPKEVASMLDISVKTVSTHRRNIMDKTASKSVAELTKYAIREGLTSLDV
jgi:DNA-binding NarL/FixJ family response regulator